MRNLALALALLHGATFAAPLVIVHDSGRTVPVVQYLTSFFEGNRDEPVAASVSAEPSIPMPFPVRTPSMSPRVVERDYRFRNARFLNGPMFIIGSDDLSKRWLMRHQKQLLAMNASGIVVNVASFQDFRSLQQLAPQLPLAPSSIDELARSLGLSAYPLLIRVDGLITQKVNP